MSDNSHIDKIFKDGVGEKNFANVDAMWQKMEAELNKETGKKRKPFVLFAATAVLLTAGFLALQFSNTKQDSIIAKAENQPQKNIATNNTILAESKQSVLPETVASTNNIYIAGPGNMLNTANNNQGEQIKKQAQTSTAINNRTQPATSFASIEKETPLYSGAMEVGNNNLLTEKIYAEANLIVAVNNTAKASIASPALNMPKTKATTVAAKNHTDKQSSITIEAVGGGDFLRLNRKAGYYTGVRVNKHLDKGTVVSIGLNYTYHAVHDYYRIYDKPLSQRRADANLSTIKTIRMPVYIQREMGNSKKLALMAGLVPTYITDAVVSNEPDSYVGNPEPNRKFTIKDLNRLNMLFGAGIKYSPSSWVSLEISGSYGLTGMVKDAYRNQSRVNDNFKSLQAGLAFRLK